MERASFRFPGTSARQRELAIAYSWIFAGQVFQMSAQ